jgi:hypothetical protein
MKSHSRMILGITLAVGGFATVLYLSRPPAPVDLKALDPDLADLRGALNTTVDALRQGTGGKP